MKLILFLYILQLLTKVNSQMEPFIKGGEHTTISKYPHAVYLSIVCTGNYLCGASILNQAIVLTAAHCLEECTRRRSDSVTIKYGHEQLKYMQSRKMTNFKMHDNYDKRSTTNDICLITCKKPIELGHFVKRAIVMQSPPKADYGYVAGWGVINENHDLPSTLKHTSQKMQPPQVCKLIDTVSKSQFCAGPINGVGNPLEGDSGSALIINSYIQIGIVSYRVRGYTLTAYTDVSYYYDWIITESNKLYCN